MEPFLCWSFIIQFVEWRNLPSCADGTVTWTATAGKLSELVTVCVCDYYIGSPHTERALCYHVPSWDWNALVHFLNTSIVPKFNSKQSYTFSDMFIFANLSSERCTYTRTNYCLRRYMTVTQDINEIINIWEIVLLKKSWYFKHCIIP
jgi:hypothetical protein